MTAVDPAARRRRELIRNMSPEARAAFLKRLRAEGAARARGRAHQEETPEVKLQSVERLPHQDLGPLPANKFVELRMGGRGSGKSKGLTLDILEHIHGPACDPDVPGGHRLNFIGPTLGDLSEAFESPAGLRAMDPRIKMVTRRGGTVIEFPTGARARALGAFTKQDAQRLRASTNVCFVAIEEMAACRQIAPAWDQMMLGLRLGPNPWVSAATTPRSTAFMRKMVKDPEVRVSHATLFDNPYLSDEFRERILRRYEGTRLYRQEVLGELLEDVFGALWTSGDVDMWRVPVGALLQADNAMDLLAELGSAA